MEFCSCLSDMFSHVVAFLVDGGVWGDRRRCQAPHPEAFQDKLKAFANDFCARENLNIDAPNGYVDPPPPARHARGAFETPFPAGMWAVREGSSGHMSGVVPLIILAAANILAWMLADVRARRGAIERSDR